MHIRYGFDIEISLPQEAAIVTLMDVHPERQADIVEQSAFKSDPVRGVEFFVDSFGNMARRVLAPAGMFSMRLEGIVADSGMPDVQALHADVVSVWDLPAAVLPFLTGSRYCETDLLSEFAWSKFSSVAGGWNRVQAICDFVNDRLIFSYPDARATRTASEALAEGTGVCRDFTHLAVTLCRCLNIPARYCNGYLGDIGVPLDPAPMDFNAWFEVYLGGRWYTFDARHNTPRIGRILIARGRDAADIPMITSYGPHLLSKFSVITQECDEASKRRIAA
jgi:transglutaminase-like putative cysteine protease